MKTAALMVPICALALIGPTLRVRVKRLEEKTTKMVAEMEASKSETNALKSKIKELESAMNGDLVILRTVEIETAIRDRMPRIFAEKLNASFRFKYAEGVVKAIKGKSGAITWMFVANGNLERGGKVERGQVAVFFKPRVSAAMTYSQLQRLQVDDIRIGDKVLYRG